MVLMKLMMVTKMLVKKMLFQFLVEEKCGPLYFMGVDRALQADPELDIYVPHISFLDLFGYQD